MSAGPTLLRYASADVGYGGEPVVRDAWLDLAAGEVAGLVGPNGAGKSTLLRVVTGDAELLGGSVELAGLRLADIPPRERARLVGVVPQHVTAAFSLPAVEYVSMGRHPHLTRFATPDAHDREVVARAMAMTDTARLAAKPTDALSGGDLQRLALAQALAQEPRLLLLDEPVSHLDLNHRLQVLELVRDLADRDGLGVLAVFHDLDLAARFSDRVAVVSGQALGKADTPELVITADLLREVFGVRAVVGTDAVSGAVSVTPVLREASVAVARRGRVLVIGGSGAAAPLFRRLTLAGWEIASGALNVGDADQVVAEAIGLDYAQLPPFAPMDAAAEQRVAQLASGADAIVITEAPFGHGNVGNLRVAISAASAGAAIVLVGDIVGRDYADGEATALWTAACDAGAIHAVDLDAAEVALGQGRTCAERAPG